MLPGGETTPEGGVYVKYVRVLHSVLSREHPRLHGPARCAGPLGHFPKTSILLHPDFSSPSSDFGDTVFVDTPKGALGAHTLSEPIAHGGESGRGAKMATNGKIAVSFSKWPQSGPFRPFWPRADSGRPRNRAVLKNPTPTFFLTFACFSPSNTLKPLPGRCASKTLIRATSNPRKVPRNAQNRDFSCFPVILGGFGGQNGPHSRFFLKIDPSEPQTTEKSVFPTIFEITP